MDNSYQSYGSYEQTPAPAPKRGKAIASMALGIASTVLGISTASCLVAMLGVVIAASTDSFERLYEVTVNGASMSVGATTYAVILAFTYAVIVFIFGVIGCVLGAVSQILRNSYVKNLHTTPGKMPKFAMIFSIVGIAINAISMIVLIIMLAGGFVNIDLAAAISGINL